jgi:hypothetical protein
MAWAWEKTLDLELTGGFTLLAIPNQALAARRHAMTATTHSLWFTQMIEYEVPASRQVALAEALVARSEELAARCQGLQSVSIQTSDDGSRVLQNLQWQSRQAWVVAAELFAEEPFFELLRRHQARGVNLSAYQAMRSLIRGADGGLHCQVADLQAYQGA